jgi:uncharacterized protein YjbI with pentapeptide repeats
MFGLKPYIYLTLFPLSLFSSQAFAGQLSPSTEVQANITLLTETKSCPQCDLSGADLNRLDLSGANLEGANLSRAKMSLTNLSGANLHNADLREAIFNGADLANIDLRGADLTGASLVGAYMSGALMDGEMVLTTPYNHEGLSDIEETVYVEDTVNPKVPQETEEMTIGSRRDFEETPPVVPIEKVATETVKSTQPVTSVESVTSTYVEGSLPKQSATAPAAKVSPAIQEVRIEEEVIESEILLSDEGRKQLSTESVSEQIIHEQDVETVDDSAKDAFAENDRTQIAKDDQQDELPQKTDGAMEMVAVASGAEERQLTQQDTLLAPGADSDSAVTSNADQGKPGKVVANEEDIPEAADDSLAAETAVEDPGAVDQAVGMVQSMFNVFSSDEPSTEVMKNVAILLDMNQCYGCNLAGVNLSGENLDSADLEGADLSNAILKGVDLEGANLKGVNLTGADLSGADLSEADMYKAILIDADLTDANLEDTMLDNVNFSGVKGYKKQSIILMEQN